MNKAPLFLLGADWHLEGRMRKSLYFMKYDWRDSLERVADLIAHTALANPDRDVKLMLAGDTLDSNHMTREGKDAWNAFLSKMVNHHVEVIILAGNHDMGNPASSDVYGDLVTELDGAMVIGGVTCYGVSGALSCTAQRAVVESLDQDIDLMVMHASFEHLMPYSPFFSIEDFDDKPNIKNIVVGDIHLTDITRINSGGYLVSPGSLHPLSIDKSCRHGIVQWDPLTPAEPTFLEIPSRNIMRAHITNELELGELEELLKTLPPDPEDIIPLMELKYPPVLSAEVTSLVARYTNVHICTVIVRSDGLEIDMDDVINKSEEKTLDLAEAVGFVIDKADMPLEFDLTTKLLTQITPDNTPINTMGVLQEFIEGFKIDSDVGSVTESDLVVMAPMPEPSEPLDISPLPTVEPHTHENIPISKELFESNLPAPAIIEMPGLNLEVAPETLTTGALDDLGSLGEIEFI